MWVMSLQKWLQIWVQNAYPRRSSPLAPHRLSSFWSTCAAEDWRTCGLTDGPVLASPSAPSALIQAHRRQYYQYSRQSNLSCSSVRRAPMHVGAGGGHKKVNTRRSFHKGPRAEWVEEQRHRRHRYAAAVRGEAPGGCAGAALRFTALVSSNVCWIILVVCWTAL